MTTSAPRIRTGVLIQQRRHAGMVVTGGHDAFDTSEHRVTLLAPAAKEAIMTIAEELSAQGLKQGL